MRWDEHLSCPCSLSSSWFQSHFKKNKSFMHQCECVCLSEIHTHLLLRSFKMIHQLHPGRLTWNLKITQLKRKIIFQTIIFRFHVHLPGWTVKNVLERIPLLFTTAFWGSSLLECNPMTIVTNEGNILPLQGWKCGSFTFQKGCEWNDNYHSFYTYPTNPTNGEWKSRIMLVGIQPKQWSQSKA